MEKRRKGGVELILKARVENDVAKWMEKLKGYGEKSNVTSKALLFFFEYLFCTEWFYKKIIKEDYQRIKRILRKVGREREKFGY